MSAQETARKIRSMEVRGALSIAVAAVKALEQEVVEGASYAQLTAAADILRDARPSAVSLPNAVNYVLHLAETHQDDDPAVARPFLLADVTAFLSSLESSAGKAAEYGASLVVEGDVILTICNSSTVVSSLALAWASGKRFRVFACETRPRWQGRITAKELASAGVDVTLIVDSAAYHTMRVKGVNKILVGADTVYASGDIVNKVGTSQVALAGKSLGIPVIVCTETIKFYPLSLQGASVEIEERDPKEVAEGQAKVFNPAFDVTSAECIINIVTEDGIISPSDVRVAMEEKFSWMLI
jgi:ribose 1,5-bisphosphate isomerase